MAGYNRRNRMKGSGYPIELYIVPDARMEKQWERQQGRKAVTAFNRQVRAWGTRVNDALQYSIAQQIAEDNTLSASLKQNYRHWGKRPQTGQEITSIGFAFEEAGLYVHLGVGRGYNREGNTVVMTKKNKSEFKRRPKPWFDPVVEQYIPELQKIVQAYCGDLFIDTTRILINR